MSIAFRCDQCGKHYAAGDHLAGKAMKCRDCGKVMRIPGTPPPAAVPPPIPAPPPLPQSDLYGLDDGPGPASRGASAGSAGFDEESTAPLPRAGTYEPPSKEKSKRLDRRAKQVDAAKPSYAKPFANFSIGTAVFLALFGLRVYNRVNRGHRPPANRAAAGAPVDASPIDLTGPVAPPSFPDPGPAEEVEPGVVLREIRLGPDSPDPAIPGHRGKLWLYTPAGQHGPKSLPCVLYAGAGSDLISGMDLGEGDVDEHVPWVKAGFAVLAYELDGSLADRDDGKARERSMRAFLKARAGLVNAHNALEYLLARVPEADPDRVYAAGHSSAGTLALLFAEHEPRLKGCVAFAPVADVSARLGFVVRNVVGLLPGGQGSALYTTFSPRDNEAKLSCPLLLFHAQDDSNVPVKESIACADRLKALGKDVTLKTVPTGDHYDAMIRQGIPTAIQWVKGLPTGAR